MNVLLVIALLTGFLGFCVLKSEAAEAPLQEPMIEDLKVGDIISYWGKESIGYFDYFVLVYYFHGSLGCYANIYEYYFGNMTFIDNVVVPNGDEFEETSYYPYLFCGEIDHHLYLNSPSRFHSRYSRYIPVIARGNTVPSGPETPTPYPPP